MTSAMLTPRPQDIVRCSNVVISCYKYTVLNNVFGQRFKATFTQCD